MANFAVLGGAARVLKDSLNATQKKINTVRGTSRRDTEPLWLKTAPSMNDGENPVSANYGGSSANDYYDDLLKSQQTAVNEQTQSALDANNAYIPKVNQYQDKRLQDAYILKEQNRVNLPQQLSALGYSGGATETSMLGEMTNYQNNRNNIESDRNEALNNIYQNAAQIRSTGNANLADLSAQYYQNLIAKQQQDAAQKQNDFASTVGAYSNDYMAKINQLREQGYSDDSYEIKTLLAARNDKIANQASAKSEKEQQALDNYIRMTQLNYNVNRPYFSPNNGGNSNGSLTESDINSLYNSGLLSFDEAIALLRGKGIVASGESYPTGQMNGLPYSYTP